MTPNDVLAALGRASLEGGLFLLALWAIGELWPRMPAAARKWAWWLGTLRLLLALAPTPRADVSLSPPLESAVATTAATTEQLQAIGERLAAPISGGGAVASSPWWGIGLSALAFIWAAGVIVGVVLMTRRLLAIWRRWRAAAPFTDPRLGAWRSEWAFALGEGRTPRIRVCAETRVPMAVGVLRQGILLPREAETLDDGPLRLILAHELSHLRRRDPLLGWVPALAELLFWFHPLARLAAREYLAAREELCDADALRATNDSPHEYGALLLGFAVGRHSLPPGTASCGTPAGRHLKRRLEMLSRKRPSLALRAAAGALIATFLIVAFAPIRLSASETHGDQKIAGERTHVAYLIKQAGKRGTRGSIHIPSDERAARDLNRLSRDAVYFRIAGERWITYDEETMREVWRALEPEDRFETEKEAPIEAEREELEGRQERLETQIDALEPLRETLQERMRALDRKWEDLKDQGRSTSAIEAERDRLGRERDALQRRYDDLAAEREAKSGDLHRIHAREKLIWAERDRIHRQTLREIERIARRAVARGVAVSFASGGSRSGGSGDSESSARVFSPPATPIR